MDHFQVDKYIPMEVSYMYMHRLVTEVSSVYKPKASKPYMLN
jgi:hypothetical protein